jgi:hypothetical protein
MDTFQKPSNSENYDIHASSGIWTLDSSVREREEFGALGRGDTVMSCFSLRTILAYSKRC